MLRIEIDGQIVERGWLFRDSRKSNIRTLRVEGPADCGRIELTVIRQEYDGEVTEPMRTTVMAMDRLMSKAFERVSDADAVAGLSGVGR